VLLNDRGQDEVDVYGRWLRYVERDGRDVGRAQVLAGAAPARESSSPVARHEA
jgi:micrococcal nuclease